jgi:hypothetical protein
MQKDLAQMRTVSIGTISLVLVVVSASSLISMFGLFQIERMVNQDLYRYGLQFSYAWAMPYWTITKLMFATGWFNIIAAVAFHIYMLSYGQKETRKSEILETPEILETTKSTNKEKMEPEPETKPTEPVEQQKEQEPKPTETVEEKPIEMPTPVTETQTQEKKKETSTAVTETPSETQTEQLKTEPEETPSKAETPQEIELQPSGTSIL